MLERTQWFTVCFSILISPVFQIGISKVHNILMYGVKIASLYRKKKKVMWAGYAHDVSPMHIHAICHVSMSIHTEKFARIWALRSVYEDGIIKYSFSVFQCFGVSFFMGVPLFWKLLFPKLSKRKMWMCSKRSPIRLNLLYNFSLDGLMYCTFHWEAVTQILPLRVGGPPQIEGCVLERQMPHWPLGLEPEAVLSTRHVVAAETKCRLKKSGHTEMWDP